MWPKIFDGGYICHQIVPYLRSHVFYARLLVRTMVYGDSHVKNNHPSPSWASNIILTSGEVLQRTIVHYYAVAGCMLFCPVAVYRLNISR